jgi:hypothetical protein
MNKYLEKVAKITPGHAMAAGATIGAAIGGYAGYHQKQKKVPTGLFTSRKVDKTNVERVMGGIGGAVLGAYGGAAAGAYAHPATRKGFKEFRQQQYQYRQQYAGGGGRSAGNTRTARTIHNIHEDLGMPKGGFKTKKEATDHFRRARSKAHPDRHGGNHSEMAKLNRAWDEFQAHPEGFTKLANAYLEKIAGIDINKVKAVVRANPGAVIGGTLGGLEGLSSTTKKKHEGHARFMLRQAKNTAVGVAGGSVAGKFVQEAVKHVSK